MKTTTQTIESKTLCRALKALVPFISKDETRFHLNGVLLDLSGEKVVLVATDGHKLGTCQTTADTTADVPKDHKESIIPLKSVKAIMAAYKQKESEKPFDIHIEISENEITLSAGSQIIVCRLIESAFPPYRAVIPPKSGFDAETNCIIGVNPKYLVQAGKAALDFAPKGELDYTGIQLVTAGELDPIVYRIEGESKNFGQMIIVIMPMRVRSGFSWDPHA